MKPDLTTYSSTVLRFHANLKLTSSIISKIREISPADAKGDSLFMASYKGHRAHAWVMTRDKGAEGSRKFTINFNYSVVSGRKLSAKAPPISDLIDILTTARKRPTFQCQVYLDFGKRMKPKSLIRLPMEYTEFSSMPFDRIQGVHLVKLDGEDIKYDVILEAPTKGAISANILFKCTSRIDQSLADRILLEAETIAAKFVLREQQDGKSAGRQEAIRNSG